jgi:hypothetical protein
VDESTNEDGFAPSSQYVQRVAAFLDVATGWCRRHGLSVEHGVVPLREEKIAEYQAPSLRISKDGVVLANIVPAGSRVIGAQGRLDLIGRITRHALLFYGPEDSVPDASPTGGKASGRARPRVEGWCWIEARIRPAKRVEEGLFLDLLTDVSDYEFS